MSKEPMDPELRAHLLERLAHRAERLAKCASVDHPAHTIDAVLAMMAGHVTQTAIVLLGEVFAQEMLGHILDGFAEASSICRFCHVRPIAKASMCSVCWDNAASDDDITDEDLAQVTGEVR